MESFISYGYVDSKYDYLRKPLSDNYYRGEYKAYVNLYSFSKTLRNAVKEGKNDPIPGWGTASDKIVTLFEAIRWAKEIGTEYVDPAFYFVPGYDDFAAPTDAEKIQIKNRVLELRKYIDGLGMKIYSTGIKNDFCSSDASRLAKDLERAKFYLEMSELLGATMMRVFVGEIPDDIEKMGFEKVADDRFVHCVTELADYCIAKGYRCMVGYQNHGDLLSTANQVLYVEEKFKNYRNIALINDTGHFRHFGSKVADGYPWYDDIARCLPVTKAFQLKTKPAGVGSTGPFMDLNLFFRHLRASDFKAPISIEMLWQESDEDNPEKASCPSDEYKRQTLKFLNEVRAAELLSRSMDPV